MDTEQQVGQLTAPVPDTGTDVPLACSNCFKSVTVAMNNVKKLGCFYLEGSLDRTDAKSVEEVPNIRCHFTITKVGVAFFNLKVNCTIYY